MSTKFVVETQLLENYGAHTWDYKGACPNRWKFKGGNDYLVSGFDREQDALAHVARHNCQVNHYFVESVTKVTEYRAWKLEFDLMDDDQYDENLFRLRNLIDAGEAS